jgi:hypothetical protein
MTEETSLAESSMVGSGSNMAVMPMMMMGAKKK